MPRPTLQMVIMVAGAVMLIIGATIVVVQLDLEAKTTLLHGKCVACVAGANETVRVISGERNVGTGIRGVNIRRNRSHARGYCRCYAPWAKCCPSSPLRKAPPPMIDAEPRAWPSTQHGARAVFLPVESI
jgi:hypothetical protein